MSMHTREPWELDGFYRGAFEVIAPSSSVSRGRLVICARNQNQLREQEMLANAKLIAAAPALFEALERIAAYPRARNEEMSIETARDIARAALAPLSK